MKFTASAAAVYIVECKLPLTSPPPKIEPPTRQAFVHYTQSEYTILNGIYYDWRSLLCTSQPELSLPVEALHTKVSH